MKKTTDQLDENTCVTEMDEGNAGCQVRRKIEDYLERKQYQDELGELLPTT